ncbi:LL-diaminopimelate aminotransferase [uncultured Mailhella sp.]|uniref:LL-diaminopimelate aminotransferase n=1 Tax=uncultured Mailhella sp. TaxID=1981031 RepID=UPI0025E104CB|nr:LL-diaminopimelate aminotransferase [uncultured Mailhella sp.]
MTSINNAYAGLSGNYLFSEVARRVSAFRARNPETEVISLGIGDVSLPLIPSVIRALHKAVDEMACADTFRGYGPEQGYAFLREAIRRHDFLPRGVKLDADEIFISDGAKSDIGNFQELFGDDAVVAITDPVYPVYEDSNAMAGRAGVRENGRWSRIVYLPCTRANAFQPDLPDTAVDVVYLCSPNNPTGTVLDRASLTAWVNHAREHGSLILFDAAYEAFIRDDSLPRSIYEIPGADEVAVEFRSLSKTAGFTGLRCGYAVVPKKLTARTKDGRTLSLHDMWLRRQCTKYNGCPYIVQRAAEAVFQPGAEKELAAGLAVYRNNADLMLASFRRMGLSAFGGVHSPYIWLQTPDAMPSWDFFDLMLEKAAVVCTPGAGFGASGEGYARFTAFNSPENTKKALERLEKAL